MLLILELLVLCCLGVFLCLRFVGILVFGGILGFWCSWVWFSVFRAFWNLVYFRRLGYLTYKPCILSVLYYILVKKVCFIDFGCLGVLLCFVYLLYLSCLLALVVVCYIGFYVWWTSIVLRCLLHFMLFGYLLLLLIWFGLLDFGLLCIVLFQDFGFGDLDWLTWVWATGFGIGLK